MRHKKNTFKLNRTSSHRRCMMANLLKALITNGMIKTTVAKAKHLKGYADKMVTLAKKNTLASRRQVIAKLMIRYNTLTSKQVRSAKEGNTNPYNDDRKVVDKLFNEIGPRFNERNGGYTCSIKLGNRVGDNTTMCLVKYLEN